MQDNPLQATWKRAVGEAGAALIESDMVIGLGSGSTMAFLLQALARRLQEGLQIRGAVPTSTSTAQLATELGIPLTDLDSYPVLDLDIDGADEVNPQLALIKGGGGALLREKVVASVSRRFVVIIDETKFVSILGQRFPLPIEIVPFALTPVLHRLETLGASVQPRLHAGQLVLTDNGNAVLDCAFPQGIADPIALEDQLLHIPGIVETGLFLQMATEVIISGSQGLRHLP